jgi:hypothetical protein
MDLKKAAKDRLKTGSAPKYTTPPEVKTAYKKRYSKEQSRKETSAQALGKYYQMEPGNRRVSPGFMAKSARRHKAEEAKTRVNRVR